jgi:hypothetical protein
LLEHTRAAPALYTLRAGMSLGLGVDGELQVVCMAEVDGMANRDAGST